MAQGETKLSIAARRLFLPRCMACGAPATALTGIYSPFADDGNEHLHA